MVWTLFLETMKLFSFRGLSTLAQRRPHATLEAFSLEGHFPVANDFNVFHTIDNLSVSHPRRCCEPPTLVNQHENILLLRKILHFQPSWPESKATRRRKR